MPKTNRTQTRRAASKEALKQMHNILLGDEKRVEISSDDDVIEVDPPPKKKYKLSHRKSSDGNDRDVIVLKTVNSLSQNTGDIFDMDVGVEELTSAQKARQEQVNKEEKEIEAKIEQLLRIPNTEVIHKGVCTMAMEITEQLQHLIAPPPPPPQALASQPIVLQPPPPGAGNVPQSYQLVMDPRLGVIVGTVSAPSGTQNTPPLQLYQKVLPSTPELGPSTPPQPQQPMKTRRGTILRQVPSSAIPQQVKNIVPQKQTPQKTIQKQQPLPPAKPTPGKTLQVKSFASKPMQTKQTVQAKPPAAMTPAKPPIQNKPMAIKPILPVKGRASTITQSPLRPTESNVEGGLSMGGPPQKKVVDLTFEDGRPMPDSREVSFNKLQGRTYPSLVVVARPHLRVKDLAIDRAKLDVKVKSVLMYPPTKFTEWLIQQGLVRSDQKCSLHTINALKLGMYSDATKFPYSGGYVWISECCPTRFVSVFSGSLFEGSSHPPMSILKLLYHWCCQTIVQNVTQWVKVDNLFVKGMFTSLRAICTVALHTHIKQLGGPGIKVQVGVISLGTTSQDGNQRQVKVEVLGILETNSKRIRLRAIEPLVDGEKNYKKRFSKILEPVFNWVHPSSIIVTDLTVDKATLNGMGFLHVTQSTSTDYLNSNRTIMEYLRRIVPRMFQNTLSLLSRQIIQQFLDELVWREWYGTTVMQCFDNMVLHLSEQTRLDSTQSLVVRLNKVIANPFKNWALPLTANAAPPKSSAPEPTTTTTTSSTTTAPPKRYSRGAARKPAAPPASPPPAPKVKEVEVSRPEKSVSPDIPEQMVPLENYYYGSISLFRGAKTKITLNIKCQFCKGTFTNNIALMNHLFKHAHNVTSDVQICKYCLTIVPTGTDLVNHIANSHPDDTKFLSGFVCLICETQFKNPFTLGKHMSREHCPSELPYMCGTCQFRCSNHKQAVDHFYQQHDCGSTIQCPFCLKSTAVFSSGRNIIQNMNFFIQHLQKHQKKHLAKRCGRCNLWFIQKEFLKEHQNKMHMSQRGKGGLIPRFAPRNGVMVPKSKMDKCPDDAKIINFSTLYFNVSKTLECKECDKPLSAQKHFVSFESCQNSNCQYSTCCSNAMQAHNLKCKALNADVNQEPLPYEMYCICGHRDLCGDAMAKHLAICERKSAYPSSAAAKVATVTHSMLDVLGLVRKPEEAPPAPAAAPVITKEVGSKAAGSAPSVASEKVTKKTGPRMRKNLQKTREVPEDTDIIELHSDDDDSNSISAKTVKEVKEATSSTEIAKPSEVDEHLDASNDDVIFNEGDVTVIEAETKSDKEDAKADDIAGKCEDEVESKNDIENEPMVIDDDKKKTEETSDVEPMDVDESKNDKVTAQKIDNEVEESIEKIMDEPSKDASLDEPSNDVPLDKPNKDAPLDEPNNDAPLDEPSNDAPSDEPRNEAPLDKSSNEAPLDEPSNETPLDEASNETSLNEPSNDSPLNESSKEASSDEPSKEAAIDEPNNDASLDEPTTDVPLVEQKIDAPVIEPKIDTPEEEPSNDTPLDEGNDALMDEASKDVSVDEPSSDGPLDENDVSLDERSSEAPAERNETPLNELSNEAHSNSSNNEVPLDKPSEQSTELSEEGELINQDQEVPSIDEEMPLDDGCGLGDKSDDIVDENAAIAAMQETLAEAGKAAERSEEVIDRDTICATETD